MLFGFLRPFLFTKGTAKRSSFNIRVEKRRNLIGDVPFDFSYIYVAIYLLRVFPHFFPLVGSKGTRG